MYQVKSKYTINFHRESRSNFFKLGYIFFFTNVFGTEQLLNDIIIKSEICVYKYTNDHQGMTMAIK